MAEKRFDSKEEEEGYTFCMSNAAGNDLNSIHKLNPYPYQGRWDSEEMRRHSHWRSGVNLASYDLYDWGYWAEDGYDDDGWEGEEDLDDEGHPQ